MTARRTVSISPSQDVVMLDRRDDAGRIISTFEAGTRAEALVLANAIIDGCKIVRVGRPIVEAAE